MPNILYVSDSSGNIGEIDLTALQVVAGSVHNTGVVLTDIGFNSAGKLYGTSFTSLYSINSTTDAATLIAAYSAGGGGINALVGSGDDLLAASNATNAIYTINATTGAASTYAAGVARSSGDLLFSGSNLFESAISSTGASELVSVTSGKVVGTFAVGSVGGTTLSNVYGLANDGTTTYAIAGTQVYSVNLTNAVLTPLFDYSTAENGQNLGAASGIASINEATLASLPVYRFFDTTYGTHLFTQSSTEAQTIITTRPDLTQETNGFGAVSPTKPGAEPVYRFFETSNGTHFFTSSAAEYQGLTTPGAATYRSDLTYEANSTFYEDSTQQAGDVAVYRLFDTAHGTQFLTGNQTEYQGLTTPGSSSYRSDLSSEGIAFYAPAGSFHT